MTLGANIRSKREARGWTLEQLSERSGVEVGTISALEIRNSTRSKFALKLAAAFGCSLEELLDGDADAAPPPRGALGHRDAIARAVLQVEDEEVLAVIDKLTSPGPQAKQIMAVIKAMLANGTPMPRPQRQK